MKHASRNAQRTLTEITLLNQSEFLHLEVRHKQHFLYPLHHHTELELNFVEHYHGLRRVIGDSVEDCQAGQELVLIGPQLEHCWEEGPDFQPTDTREITIQFSPKLFEGSVYSNEHFHSFQRMLMNCRQGICFGPEAIEHVRPVLEELSQMQTGFYRYQQLLKLLYELSLQNDYRLLATESFSRNETISDNQRIERVVEYIRRNYKNVIRLEELANIAYMSPTAFSHFFSLRTHKSVSDFIIDERIGYASRLLVDTNQSIQEICYASGFQNMSNFNRQFLKRRGCTPGQYRKDYDHLKSTTPSPDPSEKHPQLL